MSILEMEDISFAYGSPREKYRNQVLNHINLCVETDESVGLIGANGVGKSTLLKLIMGILQPKSGEIKFSQKTEIAYYAQELELLDLDKTVLQNTDADGYTELQLRNILGNFLFQGDAVFKKVSTLSPGEKARVSLCKLLLARANLLILDEPTNHLDPDTQAIIGENFRDYTGTILLVSHNADFAEQIGITRMLVLPDGKIVDYSKELLAYYYILNTDFI